MTVERASGGGAGDFAAAEATWRNYCVVRKRDGRRHRVLSQLSIRIVFAIEGGSVQEMSFHDGELGSPFSHFGPQQMVLDWLLSNLCTFRSFLRAPQSR